ncbi:MAG: arginase family protein [Deltaproteobacteria bacterium]|nr:MAG: arginase family protein [Deltaproteobacteria bacterium]
MALSDLREQTDRFKVEVVEMRHWHDQMTLEFDTPIHISFDLDFLDPAFAPGVFHHEPGGLSTRQVIHLIQSLRVRIIGADMVEFNPNRALPGITAAVCARLLKEMAAKIVAQTE